MCGTDYNPNIPRIGSKSAYKRVIQHGGIDQIASETALDTSVLNHKRVRQLFTEFQIENDALFKIPFCGTPDFADLEKFVSIQKIQVNIEKLRKDFTHNIVVFEDSDDEE
jgi:5'-3' exonuclease